MVGGGQSAQLGQHGECLEIIAVDALDPRPQIAAETPVVQFEERVGRRDAECVGGVLQAFDCARRRGRRDTDSLELVEQIPPCTPLAFDQTLCALFATFFGAERRIPKILRRRDDIDRERLERAGAIVVDERTNARRQQVAQPARGLFELDEMNSVVRALHFGRQGRERHRRRDGLEDVGGPAAIQTRVSRSSR